MCDEMKHAARPGIRLASDVQMCTCGAHALALEALAVLVVEDDEASRRGTELLLSDVGMTVFTARTPSEALAIARTTDVDVLVTDLRLPEERGDRLAEAVLRLQPGVAVVFVSGERPSRTAVPGPFLQKPIDIDTLISLITDLGRGGQGQRLPRAARSE